MLHVHHVVSVKVALIGSAVLLGSAGVLRTVGRQDAGVVPHPLSFAAASLAPPPAVVPAGEPDLSSAWIATTHPRVSVLFFYHREDEGCGGPCERYGMSVRYHAPSRGTEPSAEWQGIAAASCGRFWADGVQEDLCTTLDPLAGRDRRGEDYVLLRLSVTRDQLARLLAARTVAFQFGPAGFHLTPEGRSAVRTLLGTAGRAQPR